LLEGVGTRPGILRVVAPGFQPAEERFSEPPGITHDVALVPVPATTLSVRVVSASGDALPNAVVEVEPENRLDAPQLAVTDVKGVAAFSDAPAGSLHVMATANGWVTASMRVSQGNRADAVLTLAPGYRAVVSVEMPAGSGSRLVRILDAVGRTMDTMLDSASDRGTEPPGRLSLGPLPPGDYLIELRGARDQRQERIRIVDRDVVATFR
jgi:hypothetical protein